MTLSRKVGSLLQTQIGLALTLQFYYFFQPLPEIHMRTHLVVTFICLACLLSVGCPAWRWHYPWHPVGTIYEQGNRATLHDPFPDNDLGAAVEGIRPREFAAPLALPVRDRLYPDTKGNR